MNYALADGRGERRNTREINIMKCLNCSAEILLGETCCDNMHLSFTGKKRIIKEKVKVIDYWDRLSELKRTGKFDSRIAFYCSH